MKRRLPDLHKDPRLGPSSSTVSARRASTTRQQHIDSRSVGRLFAPRPSHYRSVSSRAVGPLSAHGVRALGGRRTAPGRLRQHLGWSEHGKLHLPLPFSAFTGVRVGCPARSTIPGVGLWPSAWAHAGHTRVALYSAADSLMARGHVSPTRIACGTSAFASSYNAAGSRLPDNMPMQPGAGASFIHHCTCCTPADLTAATRLMTASWTLIASTTGRRPAPCLDAQAPQQWGWTPPRT